MRECDIEELLLEQAREDDCEDCERCERCEEKLDFANAMEWKSGFICCDCFADMCDDACDSAKYR